MTDDLTIATIRRRIAAMITDPDGLPATRPDPASVSPAAARSALGPAVPLLPQFLFIIAVNGQSLAVGFKGNPLTPGLTNPHPDRILKVAGLDVRLGLASDAATNPVLDRDTITDFEPLVSEHGTGGTDFGVTVCEGIGAGILEQLDTVIGIRPRILFYVIGRGGQPYSTLKKGTNAYANDMAAMDRICQVARSKGWTPIALATVLKHGEADGANTTYKADLVAWQADKNADYKAITGQAGDIPFIMTQPSAFSQGNYLSGLAMLEAMEEDPDTFAVVTPDYPLMGLYDADRTHFTGPGYYDLGCDYIARGLLQQVLGTGAKALRINRDDVEWDGTTLRFGFHIPTRPIAVDTVAIPDPGNWGFVFKDDSGDLPVDTMSLVDRDTRVAVTFTRAATTNRVIEFALKGYPIGQVKVIANQPRGCIRDSSPGAKNFLLHFRQPF